MYSNMCFSSMTPFHYFPQMTCKIMQLGRYDITVALLTLLVHVTATVHQQMSNWL